MSDMLLINDLQRLPSQIQTEVVAAISDCITRGRYFSGPETDSFEKEYAQYCGVNYCLGLANGTDALEFALKSLDIEPGSKVATVANAGMYSTNAIQNISATPFFIEINPLDMNMNPLALKKQLCKDIKAIIVTHLYGQLCDMDEILKVANEWQIPVIEDCSQAHGASWHNQRAGSFGIIGCFSFYPTKNLGAAGDAGAIVTNNIGLFDRAQKLRQYGWTKKFHSQLKGGRNSRLDEIQAATLRIKLRYLDIWNARRREIAKKYSDSLKNSLLQLPSTYDNTYVAHLYVVRTQQRDALRKHLSARNIGTEIHYPIPDYLQKSYQADDVVKWQLAHTESCCNEVLTIPCHPFLKDEEVDYIIEAIKSFRK